MSPRFLPVVLEDQLVPGSFAHATYHLVDVLDLSGFDRHFRNDQTNATAHAPSMLLKAVLLAYSQGIVSACAIERACCDNASFIAITGDAKPHFTMMADFVTRSRDAIASVSAQLLMIVGKDGLISQEMFAIDGVRFPANGTKYRSGTRAEFLAKAEQLERVSKQMLDRHRQNDDSRRDGAEDEVAEPIARMTQEATRMRGWLNAHPADRDGARGSIRKLNLPGNESTEH
ncbi:transposase [Ahniella affigens]|uniref:transposase n=1 Tax=Ahniella affigens TaxID=2021234 RepID=UPI001F0B781A|nr:transposase [Ahniella affigens]